MNRRISELERLHHDLNEQLRSKRQPLRRLIALQTDNPGALSEQQMMIELHAALRKQRVQMHLELVSARAALAADKERVVRTANPASPEIGEDTRAKTQTLPSQLADRVRLAELTIQALGEEMQKCKVATKQSHEPSLDVETLQEQIAQIQKIDQRITETIEYLKIETKAESRVVLYREAEPTFGREPDPVIMETVGGVTLSALAIWFIVRLVNRRSLRRLSLKTP
jgi:tRNA(Met) C34 N-acetyltransferase TmcA